MINVRPAEDMKQKCRQIRGISKWIITMAIFIGLFMCNQVQANKENLEEKGISECALVTKYNFDEIKNLLKSNSPKISALRINFLLNEKELEELVDAIENNMELGHIVWHDNQVLWNNVQKIEKQLADNNKDYRDHPNDYVHGLLSKHAYKDSKEGDLIILEGILEKPLENWKVAKIYDDNEKSGYYGVIYQNDKTHQLILANRGTDEQTITDIISILVKKNSDWKTNFEEILGSKIIVGQLARNYQATQEVINKAKELGYRLSFTGHSLGAWLAELSVYYCHAYFNYTNTKAVTFDSPGSLPMMEQLQPSIENEDKLPLRKLKIISYLASPNPANSCNPHVGKIYRVYPEMLPATDYLPTFFPKSLNSIFSKIIDSFINRYPDTVKGVLAVTGHDLGGILATFDPETGKPRNCMYMSDWPYMKYSGPSFSKQATGLITETIKTYATNGNVPSRLLNQIVDKIVGENTIMTLVGFLKSVINNEINQNQYWLYYKNQEFKENNEESPEISEKLNFDQRFELIAKAKYRPGNDVYILKPMLGSLDYFLYQLGKNNNNLDYLPQIVATQLEELFENYRIEPINDERSRLIAITNNCDVACITQRASRLRKVIPRPMLDLKEKDQKPDSNDIHYDFTKTKLLTNLPHATEHYLSIGGNEKEIENKFSKDRLVVISGTGGMGKSTLAAKFGEDKKRDWQVRWIKGTQIDQEFLLLAKELNITTRNLPPDEIKNKVYKSLAQFQGQQVLLIIDNVEDEEKIEKYLINVPHNTKLLITARNRNLLNRDYHVELKGFSKEEAISYLKKALKGRNLDERVLKKLQATVGELPFRLSKAATYLKIRSLVTIDAFIEAYESIKKGHSQDIEIYPEVEMLFGNLRKDSPSSWELLQYLAYLDAEGISVTNEKGAQEQLIQDIMGQTFQDFNELKKLSLVDEVIQGNQVTLKVSHRLIQTEMKKVLTEESKIESSKILEKLVQVLLQHFADNSKTTKELVRHAKTLIQELSETNFSIAGSERLLVEVIKYSRKISDHDESIVYLEKLLGHQKTIYNKTGKHFDVVQTLFDLGNSYQNEEEEHQQIKLTYLEEALEIAEKHVQGNDGQIARILSHIGTTYYFLKDMNESLKSYEKSLKMYQALFSDNNSHVVYELRNVGLAYRHLGDKDKCLEYMIEAYSMSAALSEEEQAEIGRHLKLKSSIESLLPNFFKEKGLRRTLYADDYLGGNKVGFECRLIITSRGELNDDLIKIKQKIQKNVLNNIVKAVDNYGWSSMGYGYDWGVKGYIEKDYIKKELGELNKSKNVEIALMLCFESMNLGIMKSEKKPYELVKSFVQENPALVKKIAQEHPEFFVDGSIVETTLRAFCYWEESMMHIFNHVEYMGRTERMERLGVLTVCPKKDSYGKDNL